MTLFLSLVFSNIEYVCGYYTSTYLMHYWLKYNARVKNKI